jgi:cyclase
VEVEDAINLELGGETVHVFHPGVAHTDGDLAAFLPKRKLLIAGDLWNNGYEPEADPRYGGDLRGLKRAYDRMLELPFEEVLPGHGSKGTRAQVEEVRRYLQAMEDAVAAAVAQGLDEEQTVAEVKLADWPPYQPIPRMASREGNVRMMWRSLKAEAK